MRAISKIISAVLIAAASITQTQAQTFPTKTVRVVVPFSPGGTSDALTRLVGQELAKIWKQPVIVENRPGADGGVGAGAVARSAPDGLTLFMGSSAPLVVQPNLYAKLPYDAQKDFAPISFVANVQNLLVVNPSLGVSSLSELIALAKSRKTPLTFASNGPGSSPHMAAEVFMSMAGVEMRHIPYKGSAPAMTDLIGGQVDLMFDNLPTALPMARSGRLIPLAVTGATRSPLAKDIPTVAESGLPAYDVTVWYGLLAPTGTPATIVSKISKDLAQVLASADVRDQLIQLGTEPASMTPEKFTAFMGVELGKWGKIIRDAKISVE